MSAASRLAPLLLALVVPAVFFGLVEGCSSTLIAVRAGLDRTEGPSLRRHDAELGWVSLPSLAKPDLWGPGQGLHTTPEGFRGRGEVSRERTPGKQRVVCSGDSFTYGEGVGDEQTWCHLLAERDRHVETVNLGMPGYGVDQAHLRFRRDAAALALDLHVFAFIGPDLTRAGSDSFHGYAKPTFVLEDGELVLQGVPVPEWWPTVGRFFLGVSESLRVVEFARRGIKKLFGKRNPEPGELQARLGPTIEAIFQDVARDADERGFPVLFVYLPLRSELVQDGPWKAWLEASFARTRLPFVDLTPALRSEAKRGALFLPEGTPSAGHYSVRGNAWAAEALRAPVLERLAATRR